MVLLMAVLIKPKTRIQVQTKSQQHLREFLLKKRFKYNLKILKILKIKKNKNDREIFQSIVSSFWKNIQIFKLFTASGLRLLTLLKFCNIYSKAFIFLKRIQI